MDPGETKNREGRMFPLTPELRAVLERQLGKTGEIGVATGRIIPLLLHRNGKPIRSFRRAWLTACNKAGVPGRIPPDFRRMAVRNMVGAGIPERVAMTISRHKPRSVFARYDIVSETSPRAAAQRLSSHIMEEAEDPKVDVGRVLPSWGEIGQRRNRVGGDRIRRLLI